MYLKLILCISLFLFIFVTISGVKNCKCSKNKNFVQRRYKRGDKDECVCPEGSSAGGSDRKFKRRKGKAPMEKKIKLNKKALYICDNFFYSHLSLNSELANILSEEYVVDMLIYSKEGGKTVDEVLGGNNLNKFRIIEVPINPNRLDEEIVDEDGEDEAYNEFANTPEFFLIGIYKEIIKNEVVYIDGVQIGIYDWLQQQIKDQEYSLGIAEFNQMAASFYVFKLLGIKNTFNVSVSVFFPGYLQFLEINGRAIDVTEFEVPEFLNAEPKEWIFNNDKGEFYWNQAAKDKHISLHLDENVMVKQQLTSDFNELLNANNLKKLRFSLVDLFKNIKFHFMNQHKFTNFKQFPKHPKIIYIGGFLVEKKGILTKREKVKTRNGCVAYVSFGSVNIDGDMEEGHFAKMISAFKSYSNCKFNVRVKEERLSDGNVDFVKGFINQQEVLAKDNIKLFISQCGLLSVTESIYAGVPLICIPSSGDQFYISSLVEHLGIGIYIKAYEKDENAGAIENENFEPELSSAITNIIEKISPHQSNTLHMREKILDDFDNDSEPKNKETFLVKIREGI